MLKCYDELIEKLRKASVRGGNPRRQSEILIDTSLSFACQCPQYFDIIFFVLQREIGGPRHAWLDREQLASLEAKEAACRNADAEVLSSAGARRDVAKLRLTVEAAWRMLAAVVYFWRNDPEKTFAAASAEAKRVMVGALFG